MRQTLRRPAALGMVLLLQVFVLSGFIHPCCLGDMGAGMSHEGHHAGAGATVAAEAPGELDHGHGAGHAHGSVASPGMDGTAEAGHAHGRGAPHGSGDGAGVDQAHAGAAHGAAARDGVPADASADTPAEDPVDPCGGCGEGLGCGLCCQVTGSFVSARPAATPSLEHLAVADAPTLSAILAPRSATPYLLPFANAPPHLG